MKSPAFGFTLVELLIVIAVIGILAASSIPVFSSYTSSQRLSQTAKNVKNDLRSAQNRAISGVEGKAWGMSFNGSNSYTIFTCTSLSACTCNDQTNFTTKSLATGFEISSATIIFDAVSGDICANGSSLLGSTSFTITLSGVSRTITVSAGGKIEEQ